MILSVSLTCLGSLIDCLYRKLQPVLLSQAQTRSSPYRITRRSFPPCCCCGLSLDGIRERVRGDAAVDQGARLYGPETIGRLVQGRLGALRWWCRRDLQTGATGLPSFPFICQWHDWKDGVHQRRVLYRQHGFIMSSSIRCCY